MLLNPVCFACIMQLTSSWLSCHLPLNMPSRGCKYACSLSTSPQPGCSCPKDTSLRSWYPAATFRMLGMLSTLRRIAREAAICGLPSSRCASCCASPRSGRTKPFVPYVRNSEQCAPGLLTFPAYARAVQESIWKSNRSSDNRLRHCRVLDEWQSNLGHIQEMLTACALVLLH